MRLRWFVIWMVCACGKNAPQLPGLAPVATAVESELTAVAGVHADGLKQLLLDHWEFTMKESPVWATQLGDHRYDDKLGGTGAEGVLRFEQAVDRFLERARSLDITEYSSTDRVTFKLFLGELETTVASRPCQFWMWSVSPRNNAYVQYAGLPDHHVVRTPEDGENLLARYKQIMPEVAKQIKNLERGLSQKRVANAKSIQLVIDMLEKELEKPAESSPFYAPIRAEHPDWESQRLSEWRAQMTQVLGDQIIPGFQRYRAFLLEQVLPAGRGAHEEGLTYVPDGDVCYQALIQSYTTLPKTADGLHQTGLAALKEIHREFQTLGPATVDTDDLPLIFERLRTQPALYFENKEQVIAQAEASLEAASEAMSAWFGRLPQAPCTVTPIPDHEAPYTTIAYYSRPHADGSKPGEYYINTYQPTTRPRHEAEVLAFHEAIPGHHLQIAISQELSDLPAFRKYMGQTAFVEGWALYTERLADEMGLYTSDLDRLGMLSFDAWRASRLVVDTGIHQQGWTREQAETFLAENTPLALNNIRNEVDRYITTPGQALAYKTGQIEFWRLRRESEQKLGDDFDIKEFHDVVLGAGAVSLPILQERVLEWVAQKH